MDEVLRRVAAARSHIDPQWTPERTRALVEGVKRRRVVRQRRQRTALVGVAFAALALVVWLRRPSPDGTTPPPTIAVRARPLRLDDGSSATPLGGASDVTLVQTSAERVVLRVALGGAHFDVTRRPSRVFRVEAGGVAVEVLGTTFDVERLGDRTRVTVSSGAVRVSWPGRQRDLHAGEAGVFPPDAPDPAATTLAPSAPLPESDVAPSAPSSPPAEAAEPDRPVASPSPSPPPSPTASTSRPVERVDEPASVAMAPSAAPVTNESPAELLRSADAARQSGRPADAVAPLRALIERHPDDPGAAAAAFTLGRVLVEDLHAPAEAAAVFARARSLAGTGSLAESALAREVECWALAGDARRARERAETYLRLYPAGNQVRTVRRSGGLE